MRRIICFTVCAFILSACYREDRLESTKDIYETTQILDTTYVSDEIKEIETECFKHTRIAYYTEKEIDGDYYLLYSELVEFQFIDMWIKDAELTLYLRAKSHADVIPEYNEDISFSQLRLYINDNEIGYLIDEQYINNLQPGEEKMLRLSIDIGELANEKDKFDNIAVELNIIRCDAALIDAVVFNERIMLPMETLD